MTNFKKRSKTTAIFVHCSATQPKANIGARQIRIWHKHDNGWLDIGYHYVIKRDGTLEDGRPVDTIGAHAYGENATSVGICLVGGVNDKVQPDANFTFEQYDTLRTLMAKLQAQYPEAVIKGHRDISAKACPSFDVHSLFENVSK